MGITEDSFEEISAAGSSMLLMKNRFIKSLDSDGDFISSHDANLRRV
jgi:hypothetical protein